MTQQAKHTPKPRDTQDALVEQLHKDAACFKRIQEQMCRWHEMTGIHRIECLAYMEDCRLETLAAITRATQGGDDEKCA